MASLKYHFFTNHPLGRFLKIIGVIMSETIEKRQEVAKALMELVPGAKAIYNKEMGKELDDKGFIKILSQRCYMTRYNNETNRFNKKSNEHPDKSKSLKPFRKNADYIYDILKRARYTPTEREWFGLMACDLEDFENKRKNKGLKKTLEDNNYSMNEKLVKILNKFIENYY